MRHSKLAPVSVFLLLCSVFVVVGFRYQDLLVVSGGVSLLALLGYYTGNKAEKRIRRHHMVIQGHAAALIGKWGNLVVFVLGFIVFLYELLRSVIRGEIGGL